MKRFWQEKGFISSTVEEFKKKLELRRAWKRIEQLAKNNGFNLNLVSDKEYHKRSRPMPRGGALYSFGDGLYVRFEIISPEEVRDFIEKQKTSDPQHRLMKNFWQEVVITVTAFLVGFVPIIWVNVPTNHPPDLAFLVVRYCVVPIFFGAICTHGVSGFFLGLTGRKSEIFLRRCDVTRTTRW